MRVAPHEAVADAIDIFASDHFEAKFFVQPNVAVDVGLQIGSEVPVVDRREERRKHRLANATTLKLRMNTDWPEMRVRFTRIVLGPRIRNLQLFEQAHT